MNQEDVLLQIIRGFNMTGAAVHLLADIVDGDAPLLGEVIRRIEAETGKTVAARYPQGRARLLEGRLSTDTQVDLTPFGSLPYTDLKAAVFQANVDRLLVGAGQQQVGRATARGRPLTAAASSHHGVGAARQYVWAGHAIDRALLQSEYTTHLRLAEVRAPQRPSAGRDKGFTVQEVREYLTAMLCDSRDPHLDALMWALFRVSAARLTELRDLDRVDAKLARPGITLGGKGGQPREVPVHRPLLEAILALADSRPTAAGAGDPLFRTARGVRVHKHVVERWSRSLHEQCLWAQGHRMRVHALRHTTARLADRADSAAAAGRLLGHSPVRIFGTTGVYLDDLTEDPFAHRAATVERAFGPLEAWPELPENDLIAGVTGLVPRTSRSPA